MNRDKLALAYWQAVDDLTDLQKVIDRVREEVQTELNAIEALPVEGRAKRVTERLQLLERNRVLTATRFEICNVRALIRTRANECAPDLVTRMARSLAAAAQVRDGCAPCSE